MSLLVQGATGKECPELGTNECKFVVLGFATGSDSVSYNPFTPEGQLIKNVLRTRLVRLLRPVGTYQEFSALLGDIKSLFSASEPTMGCVWRVNSFVQVEGTPSPKPRKLLQVGCGRNGVAIYAKISKTGRYPLAAPDPKKSREYRACVEEAYWGAKPMYGSIVGNFLLSAKQEVLPLEECVMKFTPFYMNDVRDHIFKTISW